MKKLAVFFPGIGYTVDKPLMYYSRKLAMEAGYDIKLIPYGDFPNKVKGDRALMEKSFEIALTQAEEMMCDVNPSEYDELLFVGKSIGTIVATKLAQDYKDKNSNIKLVLYTPLEDTFRFEINNAIVFTGNADPWVGEMDSRIAKMCYERNIKCISLDNANHSLETGDVSTDIEYIKLVMDMTKEYLR